MATVGANTPARSASESHGASGYGARMPTCRECDDEVDSLVTVKVDGKSRKLCEDCADRAREADEVAEASEAAVQQMMGFKGRR
jgi:ribosome-binding protein aMBF1 (putative translation factor)